MKRKDSDSEVTMPCHFGPRRRLQHLDNVCELLSDIIHASTCLDRDVIDHAYVMCPACARLTLRMRTPIYHNETVNYS